MIGLDHVIIELTMYYSDGFSEQDVKTTVAISSRAVTDLLAAYWFDVDHNDGAGAHLLFTESGVLQFESAEFVGRSAIEKVYRDRATRGPRVSRHVLSNVHLRPVTRRTVDVTSVLTLYAEDGLVPRPRTIPVAIADVHDRLVSTRRGLLIQCRRTENQFVSADAYFAVPIAADMQSEKWKS
ncbi:nuclear transport factor 2 family protein [Rhodococcus erythropolis]|uniref:nuclear transport factor 2 family protein n=1 Tax=Rhodococcus erythropolis TaxID=1833 RepID=UPI001980B826|nr:nuclear transport factor 2 family protein [Rhodococcus erythropolis]QSE41317.1 nuclear transport factor 2 family protein [Rhodococcus erythropolis]